MKRTKVYVLTGKKPTFSWAKLTIRHAVYEALKELKRADIPKIIGAVIAQDGLNTKQKARDKQIRFTLWQFARDGLVREYKDRRYRPKPKVLEALGAPRKKRKLLKSSVA